jgi:hypothetical protein
MVKRKVIVRVALTNRGVARFEEDVNNYLIKGWEPVCIEVTNSLFRTVCVALLSLPTRCTCQCSCCVGEVPHDEDCQCACDCCMMHTGNCSVDSEEEETTGEEF